MSPEGKDQPPHYPEATEPFQGFDGDRPSEEDFSNQSTNVIRDDENKGWCMYHLLRISKRIADL